MRAARMGGAGSREDELRTWLFPTLFPRDKDVSDGSLRGDMWAAGNSSAELFPGSFPPPKEGIIAPNTVGEGETHWYNPAGPLTPGMGYAGLAGGGKAVRDHA